MSFPRYEQYKDSGVEWLGAVPAHWILTPLKRLAEIQNGADHKAVEQDEGYPVYGSGGAFAFASDYLYDGESVLLGRKGTIDKPLYVSGRFWTVDTMYWTKIDQRANPRFVYYAATAIPFDYYSTSTALPSMTKGTLGMHLVAVPTLTEQTTIATFLDRETAKIDDLVAEQQNLIALLKEKRQALISHAVTKGLDPDVPMKDSGVEWLGEVPAHWGVVPLRWYCTCASGDGLSSTEVADDFVESFVPVIGGNGLMGFTNRPNIERAVLAIGRVGALCGNVHLIRGPAWITDNALVLAPSADKLDLKFLEQTLRSRNLNEISSKTAQPLITGTQVRDQRMPCPPLAEQQAITAFVGREAAKIDDLTTEAESTITLLQERRTALISAAVTGKIDVRDLTPIEEEATA